MRFRWTVLVCLSWTGVADGQTLGEYWGTAERESAYYKIVDIPFPREMALEATSLEVMPDQRLAIGTRRGDIYLVSGAFDKNPRTRYQRFAAGLLSENWIDSIIP